MMCLRTSGAGSPSAAGGSELCGSAWFCTDRTEPPEAIETSDESCGYIIISCLACSRLITLEKMDVINGHSCVCVPPPSRIRSYTHVRSKACHALTGHVQLGHSSGLYWYWDKVYFYLPRLLYLATCGKRKCDGL